jgi:transcription elongation GreA/GreB family factor
VVLAGLPIHPGENELSVDAAEAAGVFGKRVGDTVIDHPDSPWQQKTWTVEEILPAVVYYARDAMSNYERRFPKEPWFATAIHVGDGSKPRDFVRVVQALQERRADVDQWLALLRDQIMPLGLVAQRIGISVPELMEAAVVLPDKFGPQWVEWDAAELQAWSADQARDATALVLTDSSLKTMFDLQIHEVVRAAYRLVAPRSLLVSLRRQLAEARDQVQHGRSTMTAGDIPIQLDDVPADDARLVERAARVEALMEWVVTNVVLEPRPLDSIRPDDSEPSSLREMVGRSSFDSVALSDAMAIPMYADDLGLRRLGINTEERPSSVSTISLVSVLTDASLLDAQTRDAQLVDLVVRNYRAVPPSVPLLLAAFRRIPRLPNEELRRVFATLGSNVSSPTDAAAIAATVLRSLSMEPVMLITPVRVAELALDGLAERMRPPLAAALLSRAIGDTLTFFPLELEAIRKVCARFARRY